jgi:hypothetical protein
MSKPCRIPVLGSLFVMSQKCDTPSAPPRPTPLRHGPDAVFIVRDATLNHYWRAPSLRTPGLGRWMQDEPNDDFADLPPRAETIKKYGGHG